MTYIYKRSPIATGERQGEWVYFRNNLITKEATVPHEVKDKLEYAPSVEFDEQPDKKHCIFCDAPSCRTRLLNLVTVELCEWHYQNVNLGTIAHQVNLINKEQEKEKAWLLQKEIQEKASRKKQRTARRANRSSTRSTLAKVATRLAAKVSS
jgi:hypothetical protein